MKIYYLKLKTLGLGYTFCFLDNKTYPFIRYSFQREAVYTYRGSFNCHSENVFFQQPLFLNKNPFKVSSLGCTSVDFLSFHKMCNIFYLKNFIFGFLFILPYFFTGGCKRCAHLPCRNSKKIKVTIIQ